MASADEFIEDDGIHGWSDQDSESEEHQTMHTTGSTDGSTDELDVYGLDDDDSDSAEDPETASGLLLPLLPPAAERPTFKHELLGQNSIRLLKIMPGRSYDDLRFRLHHFSLDNIPSYVAISYRWGISQAQAAISIKSDKLNIGPNAYWALFFQRRIRQRLFVWIDSICIDQSNVTERNHQVALMARIYSQATNVYIWLGLPSMELTQSFQALKQFDHAMQMKLKLDDELRATTLEAILPLLKLDYWQRVWIIQEILLATNLTMMVGTQTISWDCAAAVIPEMRHVVGFDCQPLFNFQVSNIQNLITQRSKGFGGHIDRLEVFLLEYRFAECSDVRDKIYGLLEIWNKQARVRFEADYSKGIVDLLFTAYVYIVDHDRMPLTHRWTCCKSLLDILGNQSPLREVISRCLSSVPTPTDSWTNSNRPEFCFPMENGSLLRVPCAQIFGVSSFIVKVRSISIREDNAEDFRQWLESLSYSNVVAAGEDLEECFLDLQELDEEMSHKHPEWTQMISWRARTAGTALQFLGRRAYVDSLGNFGLVDPSCVAGDFCQIVTGELTLVFTAFDSSEGLHKVAAMACPCPPQSGRIRRRPHPSMWHIGWNESPDKAKIEQLGRYFSDHQRDALLLDPFTAFYFSEELA